MITYTVQGQKIKEPEQLSLADKARKHEVWNMIKITCLPYLVQKDNELGVLSHIFFNKKN